MRARSTEALTTPASLIALPKCGHSAVITFCEEVISEVRLKILGRLVFSHGGIQECNNVMRASCHSDLMKKVVPRCAEISEYEESEAEFCCEAMQDNDREKS